MIETSSFRRALLGALLAMCLAACGSAPKTTLPAAPTSAPVLQSAWGDPFVGACQKGNLLTLLRRLSFEHLDIGSDGPPTRQTYAAISPADRPQLKEHCTPTPLPANFMFGPLAVEVQPTAMSISHDGTVMVRVGAAMGLVTAAANGDAVYALGQGELWYWRNAQPIPIALPADIAKRQLVDVFMDGPYLWVRDAEGWGAPLSVDGPTAAVAGKAGKLPPRATVPMQVPIGTGEALVEADGLVLRVRWADDTTTELAQTHPIRAIARPDPATVVAVGEFGAVRLTVDPDAKSARLTTFEVGPTVAVFTLKDGVLLVGQDYGFALFTPYGD